MHKKIYRKISLFISFLLLLFFSTTYVYSIGVYDSNGNFTYYTNNTNPNIKVIIYPTLERLFVKDADLNFYGDFKSLDINKFIEPSNKDTTFVFNLKNNFSVSDLRAEEPVFFKLNIYKGNTNQIASTKGWPTKFSIIYDNKSLNLTNSFVNSNNILELSFNKPISELKILLNGKQIYFNLVNSKFLKDYNKTFDINLSNFNLIDGLNNLELTAFDLAGNKFETTFNFTYIKEPLKIFLLTKANDSSLDYFFSKEYPNLFDSIYTSNKKFIFKVETNKPADCYYLDSINGLNSFPTLDENSDLSQYKKLSSQHGIIHSVELNFGSYNFDKIYLICFNKLYKNDFNILNNNLNFNNQLIPIKYYNESGFKIVSYYPTSIVTTNNFYFILNTNQQSYCELNYNGNSFIMNNFNNFLSHNFSLDLNNGNYKINVNCFNKIYDKDSLSLNLEVNNKLGIKIINYTPKIVTKNINYVNITLSEDALCKYSNLPNQENNFSNLQNYLQNTSINFLKELPISNLNVGKNIFYIYCLKNNLISSSNISIMYVKSGPQISNFTFISKLGVETSWLGSKNKLHYKFNVKNNLDNDIYYFNFSGQNVTPRLINVTTNEGIIEINNLLNYSSITLYGVNYLGLKGNVLTIPLKFDFSSPLITFNKVNDSYYNISCDDNGESGCYKVFYGLSKFTGCKPNYFYKNGISINLSTTDLICAEAEDKVGNFGNNSISLNNFSFINNYNNSENVTNSTNNNTPIYPNYNEENNNLSPTPPPENMTNPVIPVQKKKTNYLLIAALLILFAGISGGGYYAYKKGYLNNELSKLGINLNSGKSKTTINSNFNNPFKSNTYYKRPDIKSRPPSVKYKSNYDYHLNKLKNFLDNELKNEKPIFSKFKIDEEKVKKGETLIKPIKKVSKNQNYDFDEFYKYNTGSSLDKENTPNDLKKDAEEFEKYYKSKNKKENFKSDNKKNTKNKK